MLKPALEPGTYVLAISGGVDSVSLLHALSELNEQGSRTTDSTRPYKLVVAHFDHGVREDSVMDRRLVASLAQKYRLPYVYENGKLGAGVSEDTARIARYNFLQKVQRAAKAQAVVTAHHQDDVIETAIFNLLRGTGRKGLGALSDHPHLRRPLLHVSKSEIRAYAREQGLVWCEDSTNSDTTISRNYIRHVLLPKIGPRGRAELLDIINHIKVLNRAIDNDLLVYLHSQPSRQTLDRYRFAQLPHTTALEVMASWLRSHGITTFDTKTLERLVTQSKTLHPGKQVVITAEHRILVGQESLVLVQKNK